MELNQEMLDQQDFRNKLKSIPAWKKELILDEIISQVCWFGPVTREWLENDMGIQAEIK